ncbi:hypothetical protein [Pseudomonas sp. PB3P13]
MPTDSEEGRRIIASLALRFDSLSSIDHVADVIISMLGDTSASLAPVIGPRGVAALHRRSLHVSLAAHPRLDDKYRCLNDPLDLMALKSILVEQTQTDAIFFGEQLLTALYELLTRLIGSSLSRRLLLDVWDSSPSAPPSQETSP